MTALRHKSGQAAGLEQSGERDKVKIESLGTLNDILTSVEKVSTDRRIIEWVPRPGADNEDRTDTRDIIQGAVETSQVGSTENATDRECWDGVPVRGPSIRDQVGEGDGEEEGPHSDSKSTFTIDGRRGKHMKPRLYRRHILRPNNIRIEPVPKKTRGPGIDDLISQILDPEDIDDEKIESVLGKGPYGKRIPNKLSDEDVRDAMSSADRAEFKAAVDLPEHHLSEHVFLGDCRPGAVAAAQFEPWTAQHSFGGEEPAFRPMVPKPSQEFFYKHRIFSDEQSRSAKKLLGPYRDPTYKFEWRGFYPFLTMEVMAPTHWGSTSVAQNLQATSGAYINRMTNDLFDRAKPYIEGDFPNPPSTISFSLSVIPTQADLWIHFSEIGDVRGEQKKVYYSQQIESYWLGKEANIRSLYRALLKILIWAISVRLPDILKALDVLYEADRSVSTQKEGNENREGVQKGGGTSTGAGAQERQLEARTVNESLKRAAEEDLAAYRQSKK